MVLYRYMYVDTMSYIRNIMFINTEIYQKLTDQIHQCGHPTVLDAFCMETAQSISDATRCSSHRR